MNVHPYRQPLPAMAAHAEPQMLERIKRMLSYAGPVRRVVLGSSSYLRLAGEVMRLGGSGPRQAQFVAPGLSPIVLYLGERQVLCEWDGFATSDACYPEEL